MKTNEFFNKLLIKPKEYALKEGVYRHDAKAEIATNAECDFSYLLSLAGFEGKPTVKAFEGMDDVCVLSVGENKLDGAFFEYDNDEAYYMAVGEKSLLVVAKTEAGMLLGLKAFIRMREELGEMPQVEIWDWPDIPFRAVHTCIFRPEDGTKKESTSPEDIKRVIKAAALAGYNHVIIEFWGMFPYKNEWAHWPEAYTRDEVKDLVSFAIDKMHVIPIPDQNLTSHAAWSRIASRQHVVLDQRPDLADMYIPGGWCFATENPKVKAFLT
ncbi:MAG: hypothetical protein J6W28_00005, partial [Clostridia bacterium]|nr:hypothetical protein [Clostridia bacterium]